jgi:S1-C subfamily serine protease
MSTSLGDFSEQLADLIHEHSSCVVRVEGRTRHASSGIIWSSDGYILTSNYTVEFEDEVIVGLPDGERHPAVLVGRDPGTDLALLKLELEEGVTLDAPTWMDQEEVRLGQIILTLARPGRTLRSAMGIISTLSGRWAVLPGVEIERFIQSDCVTRAGFSGSLVINVNGGAVGVLSAGLLDRDHVILPSSTLEQAVSRILRREPPMLDLSEAVESKGSISEASTPLKDLAPDEDAARQQEE